VAEQLKASLSSFCASTYEVHTQLLLAKRLKIGDEKTLRSAEAICIETSKMLGAFIASLGKKS
jgi:four helix bundle protein